jgi:hypothetical protein
MKCNSKSKLAGALRLRIPNCSIVLPVIALLFLLGVGAPRASAWGITWSDEFTGVGDGPYSGFWSFDLGGGGWGNNEQEIYVSSWANCHIISDGTGTDGQALQIEPQVNSSGQWYSARINSAGKHQVPVNSYIEYRCKFPTGGQGYWPAAWMLGTVGGAWPACGEIDIAEEVNSQNNNHQSLHMPNWNPTVTVNINNACTTYHNYGAWWTPTYITFNCDGVNSATFSEGGGGTWEFNSNNSFFLIINCAIGGNFPGNANGSTVPNANFDIDYVEQYNN